MDSTMTYQLVLQQLNQRKQLINLLSSFSTLLNPNSKLSTNQMNDQQIFSQVFKCITKTLNHQQHQKSQLLAQVNQHQHQQSAQQHNQSIAEQQEDQEEGQEDIQNQEAQNEQFGNIQEQQNEDDNAEDGLVDQQVRSDEDDIGLYGQQIDEEQMQSYQNEGDSQEDRQFEQEERKLNRKGRDYQNGGGEYEDYEEQHHEQDEGQDIINDQFDHFREIQLQNKEQEVTKMQQKNDLQKQIQKLQSGLISKKDWVLRGQVKATQRPVNSLLQHDLQFSTGIRLDQQITPQFNSDLQKMIKQRILDQLYDDRVRYQHSHVLRQQYSSLKEVSTEKSKLGLSELYQSEFKNHLGLSQSKPDKLKGQILQAFKEVNYYLDSLSNCNFTPRPTTASKGQAVISEEKVPINMWNKSDEASGNIKKRITSQKEENKQAKRIKNKRIVRQRKKEQVKKKLNKKIQFGGMTKFQAKAIAKKATNNLNQTNIKYNQSAKFFDEMNKDKSKKPNPNIGKLKI